MSTPKRQFTWTWLLSFLFGGSILGGAGGFVWQDATDAARQRQLIQVQSDHALWLKRHDLEIKDLQIVDAARDRDFRHITSLLEEIRQEVKEMRREARK